MTTDTIRAILALLIVGVFMVITAFMALFPLLTPQQVQLNDYADFFAKTSSVYTGIIGVIVGYYFGRSTTAKQPGTDETAQSEGDTRS
jgi:branched-subunit amino acid transport protein AzlD